MFKHNIVIRHSLVALATIFLFVGFVTGGDVFAVANSSNVNEFTGNYSDGCTDAGTMMNTIVFVEFEDAGNGNSHVGYATDFDVTVNPNYDNLVDFNGITTDGIMKYYKDALATKGTGSYPGRYRSVNSRTFDNAVDPGNFEMCNTAYAPEAPTAGQQFALNFEGGVDTASTNGDWQLNCGWSSIAGGGVRSRTFVFTGSGTPSGIPAGYVPVGWGGTATIGDGGDNNYQNFGITLHYRIRRVQPSTVGPESFLSVTPGGALLQADQTMNGNSGVAEFYHRVAVSAYDGLSHNVSWDVHQQESSGGSCNRAGAWTYVTGNTVAVGGNGTYDVYARTSVGFDRVNSRYVCQLFRITNTGGANGGGEIMRTAYIPAPTPSTVTASSTAVSGLIDAQNGNAAFYHDIVVSGYDRMSHTVSYTIEQFASTANDCTSGGSWQAVPGGTSSIVTGNNATVRVYGPANAAFDHNTTLQICQRLRITNTGGANGGGTSQASTAVAGGVITPSSTVPGGSISPGETFSVTGQVLARADGGNSYPMSYTITYRSTVPIAGLVLPATVTSPVHTITSAQSTFPHTNNITMPNVSAPGAQICVRVTVSSPTLTRYFTGGISSVESCVLVANKPVYIVNGGDLLAGAAVDTGTCGDGSNNSFIKGWNTGLAPFAGASTQLTAFARDGIVGFATAARGTVGVLPPSGLSFANVGMPSGSTYGSAFGRVPCLANQWVPVTGKPEIAPGLIGASNPGTGVYTLPANSVVGNITVNNGVQQIIYVPGNLTINGNIRYNRGGWTKSSDIPALKFVLTNGGSLTINNSVQFVDGVYATEGDINTCERTVTTEYFDFCNNQLEVNGSLIAKGSVNFKRTFSDLRQAQVNPPYNTAETINYRPEVWLANWPKIEGATSNTDPYDGVSSLPPVL